MLVVMSSMSAFAADSITLGDGNDIVLNNHDEFVVPVMLESDGTAASAQAGGKSALQNRLIVCLTFDAGPFYNETRKPFGAHYGKE